MFDPISVTEAPLDVLLYLIVWGPIHAAFILAGLLLGTPLLYLGKRRYIVFVRGFVVLNILFLLVSGFLNGLWMWRIWGHVYFRGDPFADFNPVYPIRQAWLEQRVHGQDGALLNGFTIAHVQAIWFAFASVAWVSTIFLFSRVRRLWTKPKKDIEPMNAELSLAAVAPSEA